MQLEISSEIVNGRFSVLLENEFLEPTIKNINVMVKEIEPKLQTIGEYLNNNGKNEIFHIPEYQRAYSWDIANCEKLLQDVITYIEQGAKDPYFFGTIIIDCSKEHYLNLIDGQQRTTTFLLLLKAMHLKITKILENWIDSEKTAGLKESLKESLHTIFKILYRADAKQRIAIENDWSKVKDVKILENNSINELYKDEFKKIIEAYSFDELKEKVYKIPYKQKDNKYTNFFRNFKFFYNELDGYDSSYLDNLVSEFLNKCQVIAIKSWQLDQAITMFNSLNSKGMPLSDADVISAHLSSSAQKEEESYELFKEKWKSIIHKADELEQKKIVNIDNVLQQYMYIYRAKDGIHNVTTPGVRNYYISIKKELLNDPIKLCDNFSKILNIWYIIQNYPITKLLLKFNENFKLFLISYLFGFTEPEKEISEQNIIPIMECFLRLFALLEVGDTVYSSKEFKSFLFKENVELVKSDYRIESIIEDFTNHINKEWTEEDVKDDLMRYDKNVLVYLNEYLYAKEHNLNFDFDPNKVNVEHIMPASGHNIDSIREDAGIATKEDFDNIVNLLGNKILLEEDINKTIGRDWFKTKKGTSIQDKKGYRGSKFGIAKALSDYHSCLWTKEDIEKANEKAATRICNFIFSKS